jgi:hypothetical protein
MLRDLKVWHGVCMVQSKDDDHNVDEKILFNRIGPASTNPARG